MNTSHAKCKSSFNFSNLLCVFEGRCHQILYFRMNSAARQRHGLREHFKAPLSTPLEPLSASTVWGTKATIFQTFLVCAASLPAEWPASQLLFRWPAPPAYWDIRETQRTTMNLLCLVSFRFSSFSRKMLSRRGALGPQRVWAQGRILYVEAFCC